MVEIADEVGRPSLGDAIVMMAWLGVRRQDWLQWPANIFDTPYLAWDTEKTDAPVTIPGRLFPSYGSASKRQSCAVRPTTATA